MDYRTSHLIIAGYYDGPAGIDPLTHEIAFFPGSAGIRTGDWDAVLDGEPLTLRLDRSRCTKAHPFIYSARV